MAFLFGFGLLFVDLWILLLLCIIGEYGTLLQEATAGYKYLNNDLYTVPMFDAKDKTSLEEEFERRFPPPPLFPPPPPSISSDTNALMRRAIFNNLHIRIKGDQGQGDSIRDEVYPPAGWSNHKGPEESIEEMCYKYQNQWNPHGPKPGTGPPRPEDIMGSPGPRGRRGKKGQQGPVGPPGRVGTAGRPGRTGPIGPRGIPGIDGRAGARGGRGDMGPRGFTGPSGPMGHPGDPGLPGPAGENGIPGLVIFPDALTMENIALEGLIAYRSDVKQLFFRDHITWRAIKISRCGDGIVDRDMGEQCDDGNINRHDGCVDCKKAYCGDGSIQRGFEECDQRDFGRKSCAAWRKGMTGTLLCTSKCKILYSRCRYR